MDLRPKTANLMVGSDIETVPIEQLQMGDVVVVKPGESVPMDGIVRAGESSVNQASITGESMPVDKERGSAVFAGTINQLGALEVKVTRLAQDSTLAKLIQMVEEAQSQKAGTQCFLDRAEQWYAGGVLIFTAGLILVPWLVLNQAFAAVFYRAVTVMVVASPCALIISTPASYLSAIGGAARRGVLFKGGAHLETTAAVKIVAFDKTGTLTIGRPSVTDVIAMSDDPFQGAAEAERELLTLAASVEAKSEHIIGEAIVNEAVSRGVSLLPVTSFQSTMGKGARAMVGDQDIALGSYRYFQEFDCDYCDTAEVQITRLQEEGKTSILVAHMLPSGKARVIGVIAMADQMRPEAPAVVAALKRAGVKKVVMLTGDSDRVAQAIGRAAGVDMVHADLLPEDKVKIIRELHEEGLVAMVGDGVNDAPALASATLGIAMGAAGTDVAMETADVVLMSSDLTKIPYAIELGRRARTVVWQNLGFSAAVIAVLMVAALGFQLPLTLGVIGHEGSTVLVVLNGLRLLIYNSPRTAG
jgi:Cd2+/Zn2+-exporting ATPase